MGAAACVSDAPCCSCCTVGTAARWGEFGNIWQPEHPLSMLYAPHDVANLSEDLTLLSRAPRLPELSLVGSEPPVVS